MKRKALGGAPSNITGIPFETTCFCVFCTNEFSNYRILTPPLHTFHFPHGDFSRSANYPFSTPQKKDSEFRIQLSEF